ncbi:MAG: hypothetical protein IJ538_00700 [Clostridia bacterium]|nr:hypothetical protein [Clostridia bacterium]
MENKNLTEKEVEELYKETLEYIEACHKYNEALLDYVKIAYATPRKK